MSGDNTLAVLGLYLLRGIGQRRIIDIVSALDRPSRLLEMSDKELSDLPHLGKILHERKLTSLSIWQKAEEEIQEMKKEGVHIHTFLEWENLFGRDSRISREQLPPVLYFKGDLSILQSPRLAMVGTRSPSNYGLSLTTLFVRQCVDAGITTLSGGAIGIDSAVARETLRCGGRHICVLGSSIKEPYPESNSRLFDRVSEKGLLVSQFPSRSGFNRGNFPARNRTIAALSDAVLVVEAPVKSGTMITVEHAIEMGKKIYAPPADITRPQSRGNIELLHSEKAHLMVDIKDIFGDRSVVESVRAPDLTEQEQLVLDYMIKKGGDLDDIAAGLDLPIHKVLSIITTLEMKEIVTRCGTNRFEVTKWQTS